VRSAISVPSLYIFVLLLHKFKSDEISTPGNLHEPLLLM